MYIRNISGQTIFVLFIKHEIQKLSTCNARMLKQVNLYKMLNIFAVCALKLGSCEVLRRDSFFPQKVHHVLYSSHTS